MPLNTLVIIPIHLIISNILHYCFFFFFSIACEGLYFVEGLVSLFVLHKLKWVSLVILSVQL